MTIEWIESQVGGEEAWVLRMPHVGSSCIWWNKQILMWTSNTPPISGNWQDLHVAQNAVEESLRRQAQDILDALLA